MTKEEYQTEVRRTPNKRLTDSQALSNFALGIAGEAGEICDIIKKYIYHSKTFHKDDLVKEIGDCLWYLTALCNAQGYTLEEVMTANVDKLRKRFPDGFNTDDANARKDELIISKDCCICGKGFKQDKLSRIANDNICNYCLYNEAARERRDET